MHIWVARRLALIAVIVVTSTSVAALAAPAISTTSTVSNAAQPAEDSSGAKLLVSIASAAIAAISFVVAALAYRLNNRNAMNARRPVVVFEWNDKVGWEIHNVGNGPALNVRVSARGSMGPWTQFVITPALQPGGDFQLKWIGKLNVFMLGAEYSDFTGEQYTSIGQHDMNLFAKGAIVASYSKPQYDYITGPNQLRFWDAPDMSRDKSLT